ncbi:mas-related G-protein coupled receptor member H-like [Paroedura picta]|uniref:mas-related G-protein coupled receptor member H-like n=1 Tax=Paroedura picta TaxID=143630 RepID=UPI0040575470
MDAVWENFKNSNYIYPPFPNASNGTQEISLYRDTTSMTILFITVLAISVFGAMGNGVVIWLLGFRIKRNPFMTYILNLAVADFGVLVSVIGDSIIYVFIPEFETAAFFFFLVFTYSASQFLLTAISIDRCVAVFYPHWHRYKRPLRLTTAVCVLIWVLSALLTAVTITLFFLHLFVAHRHYYYQFIVNAVLCLPVMTVATVSLFIKVCLKGRQRRRGRLLTIVLLTLLFFLLFAFPYNVMFSLNAFGSLAAATTLGGLILACLNSSVNPVIYFVVGRQWKARQKETMKMILQKVFKEEESNAEETSVETQA